MECVGGVVGNLRRFTIFLIGFVKKQLVVISIQVISFNYIRDRKM